MNYTKYPQVVELMWNIRKGGREFLVTLTPKELPEDEVKIEQIVIVRLVAAGLLDFTPNVIRAIVMFALDIDTAEEVDFYLMKFHDELKCEEEGEAAA